jgi:D-alanine transaminase
MTRISYINGTFLPHENANIHMEDRGNVFSDGVYEVAMIKNGKLVDWPEHCQRLQYSLDGLRIQYSFTPDSLQKTVLELLAKNDLQNASVYIQITRGVAKRDHQFPEVATPSVLMMISPLKMPSAEQYERGEKAITAEDQRWKRRDFKTISLLPNILAKQQAAEAGAAEAILIEEGDIVTEGSSTNVFIINSDGSLQTHPATHRILGGITRIGVLKVAHEGGVPVLKKPFTQTQMMAAAECFITSTTKHILPITQIDGQKVGNGAVGAVTKKLMALYKDYIKQQVGE